MVEISKKKNASTEIGPKIGQWRPVTSLLKGLVLLYRYLLSPLLPPRCRFMPTCSEYALESLERHGSVRGSWLALRRIAKCHPIKFLGGSSGWDPVPPAIRPPAQDTVSVDEQLKDRGHSIQSKNSTGF